MNFETLNRLRLNVIAEDNCLCMMMRKLVMLYMLMTRKVLGVTRFMA